MKRGETLQEQRAREMIEKRNRDAAYPYVGGGTHCNYCGTKVTRVGECPNAANHVDHGGF